MSFAPTLSSLIYAIPFLGMILSLSLGPVLFEKFWHRHYFIISLLWSLLTITLLVSGFGTAETTHHWIHMFMHEYVPFVMVIGALFTITGGIHIVIRGRARAHGNVLLLGAGSLLASLIGTTGASMLLIRPLIEVNRHRRQKTHVIIFFIFTVANIGGCLTPLGDPPLFLGYLQGIDFEWPFLNLLRPFILVILPLLFIFYLLDYWLLRREPPQGHVRLDGQSRFHMTGGFNVIFLLGVVFMVWFGGAWKNSPLLGLYDLRWAEFIRDLALLFLALLSYHLTPKIVRHYNNFTWEPLGEVCKVFIGIFTTIIPVITMLHQGKLGPFHALIVSANPGGVADNMTYFWMTGTLSALLDNAPTYLVFFHMAGGIPEVLMTTANTTLLAISLGAVFMGAMTYIGNAPNFMVRSIATKSHVPMPGFFGYMAWSCIVLLPLFLILSWMLFG